MCYYLNVHFQGQMVKDTVLGIKVNGAPSYTLTPKQDNNHECDYKMQCL